jgi:hypothetical protein
MVAEPDRRARCACARGVGDYGGGTTVEVQPIVRSLLFKRVLRNAAFPKAKTNKAMDPVDGPATPAEGRARLENAHQKFDEACREIASRGDRVQTTIFGAVRVEDFVRFTELHTRHHNKQIAGT